MPIKAIKKDKPLSLLEKISKTLGGKAIIALEAKHRAELRAQRDAWVLNQKKELKGEVLGQHGSLYELEQRGLIATWVDPLGFVIWAELSAGEGETKCAAL